MRVESILDPIYFLSSFWSTSIGSGVCTSRSALPSPAFEVAWTPTAPGAAAVTAFVEVNVVPMDREQVLVNQTVLVAGDKIVAMGPAAKVKVPAGAVRVDGRGRYLIPGLTDMHYHLWGLVATGSWAVPTERVVQDSLFRDLAGGVTAVRLSIINGPDTRRWGTRDSVRLAARPEPLLPRSALEAAWAPRPEVPTPHIYFSPRMPISLRPDSVAAVIAAAKAAGYDFIRTPDDGEGSFKMGESAPSTKSPHSRVLFDSTVAAAHRLGMPLGSHDHILPFESVLALGAAGGSHEHLSFDWRGEKESSSPDDVPLATLQRVAAQVKRSGTWISPTLNCSTKGQGPSEEKDLLSRTNKILHQLTKALQDAGVKLLLSGDDGWTVHDELRAMVRAGLTPYQALRTGTYHPAEYFRRLHERGTVTVGKRADLVLLYGNPLQDIRHTREPAGVMLAGRWLDRVELDQRLLAWKSSGYHSPGQLQPQPWLLATLNSRGLFKENANRTSTPYALQKLAALTDSLERVPASDRPAYEPLMQRLAAELGEVRTTLTPERQERFDVIARVWLREHQRQGYRVSVAGVIAKP